MVLTPALCRLLFRPRSSRNGDLLFAAAVSFNCWDTKNGTKFSLRPSKSRKSRGEVQQSPLFGARPEDLPVRAVAQATVGTATDGLNMSDLVLGDARALLIASWWRDPPR